MRVEIRIRGQLPQKWGDWFEPLGIAHPDQTCTQLCGELPDQTALYGTIAKLRDLGLELISVEADTER